MLGFWSQKIPQLVCFVVDETHCGDNNGVGDVEIPGICNPTKIEDEGPRQSGSNATDVRPQIIAMQESLLLTEMYSGRVGARVVGGEGDAGEMRQRIRS